MRRSLPFAAPTFAILAIAGGLALSSPAAAESTNLDGVWKNPKNTVHLEIRPCKGSVCGTVVWASAKAQADVRKTGRELVGMQLFREFKPAKNGAWTGKVYVPDLNATFAGSAELIDADSLKAKGCLLVVCKTQVWTKISS